MKQYGSLMDQPLKKDLFLRGSGSQDYIVTWHGKGLNSQSDYN